MRVIEVTNKETRKEFLMLPVRLYKGVKEWIRPLDKDVESVFDPQKNKYFRNGECTRWLLINDTNEVIGRVAAFINKKTANKFDQPTGGMGFFECINDKDAAFMLFDTCKEWLEKRGMEAMDGPINFGDRDRWWGLLIEGFEFEPNYCMPYNFPYYQELFEAYGFKEYFKQFTYYRPVQGGVDQKVIEKAARIVENPSYTFEHSKKSKLEKYAEDFRIIYNEAWGKHTGVAKMSKVQATAVMKQIKPIMDERLLWFAYYDGQPVGFFLMLPEFNQIVKHLNGSLDLLGKVKFMYHKLMKTCRKIFGLVFGVVPEHQGKGLEAAIVDRFNERIAKQPNFQYDEIEMNWIGDFNPKMMKVCEAVGASIRKTHHTYRKLFDETKEFKRAPIIK
jgi:GNAT superfamily N-acetyltransferase